MRILSVHWYFKATVRENMNQAIEEGKFPVPDSLLSESDVIITNLVCSKNAEARSFLILPQYRRRNETSAILRSTIK